MGLRAEVSVLAEMDVTSVPHLQIGFFLFAAIGFNNFGQQEGNEEIY